jgi:hypothetical protein
MSNPVLIEFVQVSYRAVGPAAAAVIVQRTFQDPKHQFHYFSKNACRVSMVATVADHRLKAGRQKARIRDLQRLRAGGAGEQVGKDSGQPQHPHVEIA